MPKYLVLEKAVGQTPLQVVENYKAQHKEFSDVPMAYAGRLDPMASGKLLVLVGDECKKQKDYHGLDKEYEFSVLLGTESDTGDVLGLIKSGEIEHFSQNKLQKITQSLIGPLSLPYPKFSSKTVKGKPLHIWTLENRLDEIDIPLAETNVHRLKIEKIELVPAKTIYSNALERINSLPKVTEASKALGRDFRRVKVRQAWDDWLKTNEATECQLVTLRCVASSGTYMRSLAEEFGRRLNVPALAYSINRTKIGKFQSLPFNLGIWTKLY